MIYDTKVSSSKLQAVNLRTNLLFFFFKLFEKNYQDTISHGLIVLDNYNLFNFVNFFIIR